MRKLFFFFLFIFIFSFFSACSSDSYDIVAFTPVNEDVINVENIVAAKPAGWYDHLTQADSKEYLLLFYISGDNLRNDLYFRQMAQIARGLSSVYRIDGKPKKSYSEITCAGLWDGYNKNENAAASLEVDSSAGKYTSSYFLPNTYLFEIKWPGEKTTAQLVSDYKSFTTDLSDEVISSGDNWLSNLKEVDTGKGEVFKKFLKWGISKYNSDGSKRVVVFIAGVGGGSFGDETGTYIPPESRALCCDYSARRNYLSASEIASGLSSVGFSTDNKIEMLVIDSGYSCSLEDAFEYKDYAKALIASPSDVPAGGIDLNYFVQSLRSSSTVYSVGAETVNVYANRNYTTQEKYVENGTASLSFIDLSLINDIADRVNDIATRFLNTKTSSAENIIDSKYTFYECLTNSDYGFLRYDDDKSLFLTDYAMFYKPIYEHIIYTSSDKYNIFSGFFYQFDLGYFADKVARIGETNGSTGINSIYYHCNELGKLLSKAVVASWRNGNGSKPGIYSSKDEDGYIINGITITGPARVAYDYSASTTGKNSVYLQPYNFTDFSYKAYYSSSCANNWCDLLKDLYPEQFKENDHIDY